jgi:hypothetical protein
MGVGLLISILNLGPLYACFKLDKLLTTADGSQDFEETDRERQREMRVSTVKITPKWAHFREFGKGFWLFTAAHSFQNSCLKTFIVLSVAFLVSDWESFTKLQASYLAVIPFVLSIALAFPIYHFT